jgi:hypothetical protein
MTGAACGSSLLIGTGSGLSAVCGLCMIGHPLDSHTTYVPGTITPLVDLWLNEGWLPDYMRAVPKD